MKATQKLYDLGQIRAVTRISKTSCCRPCASSSAGIWKKPRFAVDVELVAKKDVVIEQGITSIGLRVHRIPGRLKPIFSMRDIKVVGFTPKSSAAPSTPLILQPAFCRTAKRFSRSRRRSSDSVRYSGSAWSPFRGPKEVRSTVSVFLTAR
jgi:hypothetical protein